MIDVNRSGHYVGDCRELLKQLPDACVQTCVTSPPYWGLRDYGVEGQLGLEQSPHEYVANMVDVFRGVRRVLKDDGTLWLNLGDSYAGSGKGPSNDKPHRNMSNTAAAPNRWASIPNGIKPKDLIGIPWMVAFALRDDGWWLRMDIVWGKPNPMPESVRDRPTKAHEYVFLLSKSETYFYDKDAIAEPSTGRASGGVDVSTQAAAPESSEPAPASSPTAALRARRAIGDRFGGRLHRMVQTATSQQCQPRSWSRAYSPERAWVTS